MAEASRNADFPVWKIKTSSIKRLAMALSLTTLLACTASEEPSKIVNLTQLEAAIESAQGEGLLLNFWAIWCAPCVAELPELVEVGHEYREQGGSVLGVSYDLMVAGSDPSTIQEKMREFLGGRKLDLSTVIYDEDDFDTLNERFSLPGEIPVTLAIDKTGKIVDRQYGKASKARLQEMMRKALGQLD
ncbi:MAG: thiol-disulfide isomerase/thioredoxin [Planctomycetota bacterium]|jgi:thiol-disulfide isomerase/thioredoxin